jgi:hypothetical protein
VPGQGLHEITGKIRAIVSAAGVEEVLCTIMIRHTSASLTIQENADPSARRDLERWRLDLGFREGAVILVPAGSAAKPNGPRGRWESGVHDRRPEACR